MPLPQRPLTRLPKAPGQFVGAALLLITLLFLPGLSGARAATLEETVRAAAGTDYIHGMTAAIADQEVGQAGVPILLDLLVDPAFPRRDNVVAFLTFLGGDRAAQAILRFLRDPPASVAIPEEDRALLLAPQALGHIASRGHGAALRALLAMTAHGARGGVLSRAAARGAAPEALRDDLLEMALRGLAYCNDDAARMRIREIAEGRTVPVADGRPLAKAAESARNLSQSLPGAPPGAPAGEPIGSMQQQATDPSTDAHEHRINYANHVDHNDPITDARLDQVFAEAVALVGVSDFTEDVSCCVTFVRKGVGQTFGTPGDGLDIVDDFFEQFAIEAVSIARFKVVRIINFCGMPGTNIIGCGGVAGATIMVVRKTALTSEAILWAHEYGHNTGLGHNADSRFIMHAANTGSNNGVDATECDKYHNPHVFAQADMSVIGPCVNPVCGNGTCELGENCNNCSGDCISGTGFSCGNGLCEAGDGEDCVSCGIDCNGMQSGNPQNRFCCGDGDGEGPLPCSDPVCTDSGFQCTDVPNVTFCCGDTTCEGMETSFNCAVDCGAPVETIWAFYGTAEGGTIDFTISGVVLQVITTAGQSSGQVAFNVAAAINNDPTLSAIGVTASAGANFVTTDGSVDATAINDPGLSHGPPEIPALPHAGLVLSLLLLTAALALRRRERA